MTNYTFKKFAQSTTDGKVSRKDVLKILSLLSISQLRELLQELKLADEKNTLEATFSDEPSTVLKKKLVTMFPNSKLVVNVDKKIGAGVKVRKFDMIYDFTVKTKIKNLVSELEGEI